MRAIICGGRDYKDQERAFMLLSQFHKTTPITLVIEGGAEGADRQGRFWAKGRGIPCMTFDAQWGYYGKAGGPVRNQWMLEFGNAEILIALPGGTGTENMKNQARQAGIPVFELS